MSDNLNSGSLLSSLSNGSRPVRSTTPMTNTRSTSSSALPGGLSSAQRQAINRELINAQTKQTNLLNSSATINTMLNQNQNTNSQFNTSIMRQIGAIDAASNKITSAIATQTNQLVSSINNMSNAITESINSLKEGINHLFYERAKAYSDKVMDEETQKDYDRYAKDFVKTFFSEKFWGMIASVELVSLSKLKEQSIKYLMQNKQIANMLGIMPYGDKRFENSKMVPFTKEIADAIKEVPKYLKDIANSVQNSNENQSRSIRFFGESYLNNSERLVNINEEILSTLEDIGNTVIDLKNSYTHVNRAALRENVAEITERQNRMQQYFHNLAASNTADSQQARAAAVQRLIAQRRHAEEIERAFAERELQRSTVQEQQNREAALNREVVRLNAIIANPANHQQLVEAHQDLSTALNQINQVQNEIARLTTVRRIGPLNIPANVHRDQNLRELEALNAHIRDLQRAPEEVNLRTIRAELAQARRDFAIRDRIVTGGYRGRVQNTEENRRRQVNQLIDGLNKNTYALKHNTEEVKKSITAMDLAKTAFKAAMNPMNIYKIISTGSRWVLKFMAPYMLYTMLFKMGANTLMGKNWGGEMLHSIVKAPFKLIGGIGTGDGKTVGDHASSLWGNITTTLGGFYNNHIKGILESIGNKLGEFKDMFRSWIGDVWWNRITGVIEGVKKYTKLIWDAYLNPDETNAKVARKELFRPIYEFMLEVVEKYVVPAAMWGAVGYTGIKNLAHPVKFMKELWRPVRGAYNLVTGPANRWYAGYRAADQALDRNAARIFGTRGNIPNGATNFRVIRNQNGTVDVYYEQGGGFFSRKINNIRNAQGSLFGGIRYDPLANTPPNWNTMTQQERDDWSERQNATYLNQLEELDRSSQRDLTRQGFSAQQATAFLQRGYGRGLSRLGRMGASFVGGVSRFFSGLGALATALGQTASWILNVGSTIMTIGKLYSVYESVFKKAKEDATNKNGEVNRASYIGSIFKFFMENFINPMLKNVKEGVDIFFDVVPEVGKKVITTIGEFAKKEFPTWWIKFKELFKLSASWIGEKFMYGLSWLFDKFLDLPFIPGRSEKTKLMDKATKNTIVKDAELNAAKATFKNDYDKISDEIKKINDKYKGGKFTYAGGPDRDIAGLGLDTLNNIAINVFSKYGRKTITDDDIVEFAGKEWFNNKSNKNFIDFMKFGSPGEGKRYEAVEDAFRRAELLVQRNSLPTQYMDRDSYARYLAQQELKNNLFDSDLNGLKLLQNKETFHTGIEKIKGFIDIMKETEGFNGSALHEFFIKLSNLDAEKGGVELAKSMEYTLMQNLPKMMEELLGEYYAVHFNKNLDPAQTSLTLMQIAKQMAQDVTKGKDAVAYREELAKEEQERLNRIERDKAAAEALKKRQNQEAADKMEAERAINGGLSLGVVAQWVQSGRFKSMMESAFGWIGDKIGAVVNFFKKQDYGKLFSDAMSGLGSMTGGILSALFGADKADNFSRAAYAYADKHNLRFAKSFFGGARKSILMGVENIAEHAAKTNQKLDDIYQFLIKQGVPQENLPNGEKLSANGSGLTASEKDMHNLITKDHKYANQAFDEDTRFKIGATEILAREGTGLNKQETYAGNAKQGLRRIDKTMVSRYGILAVNVPELANSTKYGSSQEAKALRDEMRSLGINPNISKKELLNNWEGTYRNKFIQLMDPKTASGQKFAKWASGVKLDYVRNNYWNEFNLGRFTNHATAGILLGAAYNGGYSEIIQRTFAALGKPVRNKALAVYGNKDGTDEYTQFANAQGVNFATMALYQQRMRFRRLGQTDKHRHNARGWDLRTLKTASFYGFDVSGDAFSANGLLTISNPELQAKIKQGSNDLRIGDVASKFYRNEKEEKAFKKLAAGEFKYDKEDEAYKTLFGSMDPEKAKKLVDPAHLKELAIIVEKMRTTGNYNVEASKVELLNNINRSLGTELGKIGTNMNDLERAVYNTVTNIFNGTTKISNYSQNPIVPQQPKKDANRTRETKEKMENGKNGNPN